jgi:hypothetical protein
MGVALRYAFLLVRARSGADVDVRHHADDRHASFAADFLGNCVISFPICPIMLEKIRVPLLRA